MGIPLVTLGQKTESEVNPLRDGVPEDIFNSL